MNEIMTKDSNKIDWVENAEIGQDFVTPDGKHNFRWDKTEILLSSLINTRCPGSMGTPEFVINKDAISDILKQEHR